MVDDMDRARDLLVAMLGAEVIVTHEDIAEAMDVAARKVKSTRRATSHRTARGLGDARRAWGAQKRARGY